jgi:23S rRNA-intervening sequence protein
MGVNRFEDLRVWQAAKKQSDLVGELLTRPEFQRNRRLSDQMDGAALSTMFNISEGFLRRNYLTAAEIGSLIELNESIARMLRRWQSNLEQR